MHDDEQVDELEDDPIEAYCVRCRHMVEMSGIEAVWTATSLNIQL